MIKLLHISDIHLGRQFPYLQEKGPDYRFHLTRTFEKAVNLAQKENVSLMLISGDLFDNNRIYGSTIGRVINSFQVLEKAGIRICILPGIHDTYDENSIYISMHFPSNVTLFTPKHKQQNFEDLDLTVYGLFQESELNIISPLKSFIPSVNSKYHVGMAYCGYESGIENNKQITCISAEEIAASQLDYLALGYYHDFEM